MSESKGPVTDDSYLAKLINAGKSPGAVAEKMGLTVKEVMERLAALEEARLARESGNGCGGDDFQKVYMVAVNQFQLLGQTLGVLGSVMKDSMGQNQIRDLVKSCPVGVDLSSWIFKNSIVLKPFQLPSPEQIAAKLEEVKTPAKN